MGGTTPNYGWPYPTGTDRVADGDNAIEALARGVDTQLKAVSTQLNNLSDLGSATISIINLPTSPTAGYHAWSLNGITMDVWAVFFVTGAGYLNDPLQVYLPTPPRTNFNHYMAVIGQVYAIRQGVSQVGGQVILSAADRANFVGKDGGQWTANAPYGWQNGDIFGMHYTYAINGAAYIAAREAGELDIIQPGEETPPPVHLDPQMPDLPEGYGQSPE